MCISQYLEINEYEATLGTNMVEPAYSCIPRLYTASDPRGGGGGDTDSLGLGTHCGICRPPILRF